MTTLVTNATIADRVDTKKLLRRGQPDYVAQHAANDGANEVLTGAEYIAQYTLLGNAMAAPLTTGEPAATVFNETNPEKTNFRNMIDYNTYQRGELAVVPRQLVPQGMHDQGRFGGRVWLESVRDRANYKGVQMPLGAGISPYVMPLNNGAPNLMFRGEIQALIPTVDPFANPVKIIPY